VFKFPQSLFASRAQLPPLGSPPDTNSDALDLSNIGGSIHEASSNFASAPTSATPLLPVGKQRKPRRGRLYTVADLKHAVALVDNKEATPTDIENDYSIPRPTLARHLAAYQAGSRIRKVGSPTWLDPADENALVQWTLLLARLGWPPTKEIIIAKAAAIARKRGKPFETKDGLPGKNWWSDFKERHKSEMDWQKMKRVSFQHRHSCTRETLNEFYDVFEGVARDFGIDDQHLFNLDESGLSRGGGRSHVAVPKGEQAESVHSDWREHITVLTCVRADGYRIPPFWILKGKING
jgi:Tc5 transposase DNA-binding domain